VFWAARAALQKGARSFLRQPALRYTHGMDFRAYAAQPDDKLLLLDGALFIAGDARPGLEREPIERELARLAEPLMHQGTACQPAFAQARALSDQLSLRAGFKGNTDDYFDPKNSFLDEVIARRTGIPISLSVVYVEVARRAGIVARPIAFPAHFLVGIDDHQRRVVIDPFNGGKVLDTAALRELLARAGHAGEYHAGLLAEAPVRQVIARMLMNLRGIYATRADHARLLVVFDRLIDLLPDEATHVRDRGLLFGRLGAPDAAVSDLQRYLALAPGTKDAADVRGWIRRFEAAAERRASS
jgi:regulator of sirC expression with transglutaminase-like and TPR domain